VSSRKPAHEPNNLNPNCEIQRPYGTIGKRRTQRKRKNFITTII